ncbi:hypothetical protein ACHAWO_009509 [Cyclotella atomus]|uniref:DUF7726 domain-containing protein n=1 Tax=Cyclotella atomus TaxID=382360 RepID=A0ABD3N480_9STRA
MNPYNNINNNNSMPPWMDYAMWQNSALNPANILNAGRSFAPIGGPSFAAAQQPMAGNSNYLMNVNHQMIPNQFPPYAAAMKAVLSSVGNVPRPPPQQYLPAANANAASNSYEDDDDSVATEMSWDHPQWIPRDMNGQQKSPNKIRGELQRYIDACKADGSMTQTQIIDKMGVNSNSFRKFMNPKTYKDQWSATQNGTYWAAAKLLARAKYEKELAKMAGGKRKSVEEGGSSKRAKVASEKKPRAMVQLEALQLIERIGNVEGVSSRPVYDSCPQLVKKMKDFLQRPGMTKSIMCLALGDINSGSLNKFLMGKGQDQCGNVAYREGWVFFEKLRILEGKSKSDARLSNELAHPKGFSLEKARPARHIKWLPPHPTFGW